METIARYMLFEGPKSHPQSQFIARIGNTQGGLKPYELMNQMNGGGANCQYVSVDKVKAYLIVSMIITDPRIVRFDANSKSI